MLNCLTHSAPVASSLRIEQFAGFGRWMQPVNAWAVVLLMFGCRGAPPSRFPDAASALGRLRETLGCSRGLQIEAKVDYFENSRRLRGNVAILAVLPEQVRIDVFSPFGVNLSTLTSDGDIFTLYELQSRQYWLGPATACNLARFVKVSLPPFALVQLLHGDAPVLAHERDMAWIRWDSTWLGTGHYTLEIHGQYQSVETISLQLAPDDWSLPWQQQRLRVTDILVTQAGQVTYQVVLDGHAPAPTSTARVDPDGLEPAILPSGPQCSAEVPHRIRFVSPSSETDLVLDYINVSHNPPLLPGVFRQPVPGGVQVLRADCPN